MAFCGGPFCALSASPRPKATRFRKPADECREQAAKAVSPLDKESWLPVAEEWIKLASQLRNAGSNGLVRARQQIGLTT
jgi:hypothetical protein